MGKGRVCRLDAGMRSRASAREEDVQTRATYPLASMTRRSHHWGSMAANGGVSRVERPTGSPAVPPAGQTAEESDPMATGHRRSLEMVVRRQASKSSQMSSTTQGEEACTRDWEGGLVRVGLG